MKVHSFVSLDGSLALFHVIIKGEAYTSSMITSNAVERIENLFISSTESGYQDGRSCYGVYKLFNTNVADENEKPLVMLTDGHSNRFNIDLMRFCRDERLRQTQLM